MQRQPLLDCLTRHTILIRGEEVARPLNIAQAADRRDAFVKVQGLLPTLLVKSRKEQRWVACGSQGFPSFLVSFSCLESRGNTPR